MKKINKLLTLLTCLFGCSYAFATDAIKEEKSHANPLNSNGKEWPTEIKSLIIETSGIANCEELGHVSNLELVCKDWNESINSIFTVIKNSNYQDLTTPDKLRRNPSVVHLVFHEMNPDTSLNDSTWNNYHQCIMHGLQNKSKLKTLTFSGQADASMFFGFISGLKEGFVALKAGSPESLSPENNPPTNFLELPHLACFKNLEQLIIGEVLSSENRQYKAYFIQHFITFEVLPNLKRYRLNLNDPSYYKSRE